MLDHMGVTWHKAPGEAEAECVELETLGIVECVWTEDADALMFGAKAVLRFQYTTKGIKDNYNIRVYRSEDILAKFRGFDREGLVLFAVICGGDYDTVGLRDAGPHNAIQAARNGLGRTLCQASDTNALSGWQNRLQGFLKAIQSSIRVDKDFPKAEAVRNYHRPLVSSHAVLMRLQAGWFGKEFIEDQLWPLLGPRFNFWFKEYVNHIIPIILVRSLAQTTPGQEASNSCYQIQWIVADGASCSKLPYVLSSVTPMDFDERVRGSSPNKWRPEERVECDQILDVILKHAIPIPNVVLSMPSARTTKSKPKRIGKPKSASPSATATDKDAQQESAAILAQGGSATKKNLLPGPRGKKRGRPRIESETNQPGSETSRRAKATTYEDRRA